MAPTTFTASDGTKFTSRAEYRKYEFLLSYTFTSKTGDHGLRKEPGSIDGQPFDLTELKDCTVTLLDKTDQIQADELHNCRVFIGACGESLFVRNCSNCVFFTACKQLRTRECVNCTFYLYCISEPIIELSTNMKFACFHGGYPEQATHMQQAGLDPRVNKWSMVFDFNDEAKTGKNWSVLRRAQYEDPWFPGGDVAEPAVPLLGPEEAARQAEAIAPSEQGGGMLSFSFNTSQEEAEAAAAAADVDKSAPPVPPAAAPVAAAPAVTADAAGGPVMAPETFEVGTKVEAKYGGGATWYLANVAAVKADGTYDLDYVDGSKETGVAAHLIQLPKKRLIGWNPNRAKAAAEKRKVSGEAAPMALGSNPTLVADLAAKEATELAEAAKAASAVLTWSDYLAKGIPGVPMRNW
eukprot:CAMPEP_0118966330 /NCGR_PEP_ID=MMETSP1173-20130426/3806_1 /TAXON_ID=1034831 /ORGANISM="Rhizochromulina marina cf, Strain CCMP1243" /LENGTH=408 /DNA_ID=CAMNT_0006915089 /DNA_START=32 /DNA_END=1258 /DNA_ORIENTATION=-